MLISCDAILIALYKIRKGRRKVRVKTGQNARFSYGTGGTIPFLRWCCERRKTVLLFNIDDLKIPLSDTLSCGENL